MKLFDRTVRLLRDNSKFKRQHFSRACAERSAYIFTVRNVVAAMLCFHRRLWFCSQDVCVRVCGRHPPGQTPSLGKQALLGWRPPGKHPPGRPHEQTPPGQTLPWADTPPRDGYCSGILLNPTGMHSCMKQVFACHFLEACRSQNWF